MEKLDDLDQSARLEINLIESQFAEEDSELISRLAILAKGNFDSPWWERTEPSVRKTLANWAMALGEVIAEEYAKLEPEVKGVELMAAYLQGFAHGHDYVATVWGAV